MYLPAYKTIVDTSQTTCMYINSNCYRSMFYLVNYDIFLQLQSNLITITTEDEQRVREESLKALERKKEEIIKEIDQKKQEFDQDIDKRTEEIAQKLEEKVVYNITDAVKRQLEEPADKDYEKRRDRKLLSY